MNNEAEWSIDYVGHGRYALYRNAELVEEYDDYDKCADDYELQTGTLYRGLNSGRLYLIRNLGDDVTMTS
jgi:hypothetical protein